jgi:hypothetical protein
MIGVFLYMVTKCAKCGVDMAGDAQFCPQCGAKAGKQEVHVYGEWIGIVATGSLIALVVSTGLYLLMFAKNNALPETIYFGSAAFNAVGVYTSFVLLAFIAVFGMIAAIKYITHKQ